ncbi:hypothetical protein LCGC14_2040090 [marine sediment metagenome]|uniref:Uncharacterized protein n=1 Tax=marine sediment metagenome TaxID=412755 RepID=A0A0F9H5L1_9ZZZZ
MRDCRECRRFRLKYEDCVGKDWYSERDLVYCPHQIIWVLKHLSELKTGSWPERPLTEEQERNYLPCTGNVPTMGGSYGNASFECAICVAADVESRLDRTSWDGDVLRTSCQGYNDVAELAYKMGSTVDIVERAMKNALRYVRGWRVKRVPYSEWKAQRKYYQNIVKSRNSSKKLDICL